MGFIISANNKGVENLRVTETIKQTEQQPNKQSEQPNFYQNQDNDSDSSLDYDSMHLMLDPHLRPATPKANLGISQRVYNEHKHMAQEYLKVQTEIAYSSRHKEKILAELIPEQRYERLETCSKLKDIVSFLFLCTVWNIRFSYILSSKRHLWI